MKNLHIEITGHHEHNFKSRKFEFTCVDMDSIKNGWIRVHLRWKSEKEEYKFKYPREGIKSYSYDSMGIELEFPEIRRGRNSIGVRLYTKKTKKGKYVKLPVEYRFKENLKYGVNLFFALKNFNDGKKEQVLYHWDIDEENDELNN